MPNLRIQMKQGLKVSSKVRVNLILRMERRMGKMKMRNDLLYKEILNNKNHFL